MRKSLRDQVRDLEKSFGEMKEEADRTKKILKILGLALDDLDKNKCVFRWKKSKKEH